MEFEGRILRVLSVRSGTSQRGEWKTLPFVFEYYERQDDRYADRVLLETFDTNIMAKIGAYLQKGKDGKVVYENGEAKMMAEIKCRVGFGHHVRSGQRQDGTSFNVNDIRLYKFELIQQQETAAMPQPTQQPIQAQQFGQQPTPFPPQVDANGNPTCDNLPF